MFGVILLSVLLSFPCRFDAISTTHHDKSEEIKMSLRDMTQRMEETLLPENDTDTNERQRRLIPYMTFYLTRKRPQQSLEPTHTQYQIIPQKIYVQPIYNKYILADDQQKYADPPPTIIYRPKITYTPFLDSNKLPGQFTPIRNAPIKLSQINEYQPQTTNKPDLVSIFDKLVQTKHLQNKIPVYSSNTHYQTDPKLNADTQYITKQFVTPQPPLKYVTVENYHLPDNEQRYKQIPNHVETIIHTYTPSSIDISPDHKNQNYEDFESLKIFNQVTPVKVPTKNTPQINIGNYKPILVQDVPEKQETYILRPIHKLNQNPLKNYRPVYQPVQFIPIPVTPTTPQPVYHSTENPNSLSVILKQLQDSNTLPHTLTPDNIDNSIKTLVNILNSLKATKLQRPIIVDDTLDENQGTPEEKEDPAVSISENYPPSTPEGGTPGKAGLDYPAYSKIPPTRFNCKTQRYKGFFGDPETHCQVWHYCDLNGGQASFLCPNGTIFSQVALTCDWWYNVKCATTTQLYVLNERLYKYILPFTPKFPEDYSGPLVDRYLALKFKEMEEKMKKQKKGKVQTPTEDTLEGDVDKLQVIEAETVTKPYTTEASE